jgi:hypothetical protein
MSKPLLTWFLLVSASLLTTSVAIGQTSQESRAPITCDIKDNVEDAACRAKLGSLFSRDGDKLTLKLDGGKSKVYIGNRAACDWDNVDTAKCLIFRLLRYYPQTRSLLVEKAFYECGDELFISRRTGSEIVISEANAPVLSPNANYLLSIDTSDACDRKYDIAVWSMQSDPPRLEFSYQAKQYENWEVKGWQDDTRITLQAWINSDKASYDQLAELVRQEGGWKLLLGKRTDRPK